MSNWIKGSDINKALQSKLKRETTSFKDIYRGEYINEDASRTPWCGVYRAPVVYAPRTLGRGANNWEGRLQYRIVVQASSFKGRGEDVEDILEGLVKEVLDGLVADNLTLDNTVQMITEISIEYGYIDDQHPSMYFQSAVILITTEAQTA